MSVPFENSYPNGAAGAAPGRPLAVLFDLDGTLIDSIELILGSMRHAFTAQGAPVPTDEEWLQGVGIPLQTALARYASTEAQLASLTAAYRAHQMEHHDRLVRCYDEVADTLSLLHQRGHPLAVVTSKAAPLARRGLEHSGIARFFEVIVGCDTCSRHKPHPEPVLTALAHLGYEANEAVFVGDSVHDIEAGNAAGVHTIGALWGPFTREQLSVARPDFLLERISGLPGVLSEL